MKNHCNTKLCVFFHTADVSSQTGLTSQGFELSREARAQADIKFTYVVSCQIYGQQKQRKAPEAADIALLLQRCAFEVDFIVNSPYFLLCCCLSHSSGVLSILILTML